MPPLSPRVMLFHLKQLSSAQEPVDHATKVALHGFAVTLHCYIPLKDFEKVVSTEQFEMTLT